MKTITKVANSRGLGIYRYNEGQSFTLIGNRTNEEMSFVRINNNWIASTDNNTVVIPFLSRRALEIATFAMYASCRGLFLTVDRSGTMREITEAEYHAIINA